MAGQLTQTDRTTISRHAERGSYDREAAYAIIDEGMVAHVGFDTGQGVIVVPMTYARIGDEIFLHGAVASRWLSNPISAGSASRWNHSASAASWPARSSPPVGRHR